MHVDLFYRVCEKDYSLQLETLPFFLDNLIFFLNLYSVWKLLAHFPGPQNEQ